MAGENAGELYFTVDARTGALLDAEKRATASMDKISKGMETVATDSKKADLQLTKTAAAVQQVAKEAQAAQNPLGGLSKLLLGMVSIQGAMGLVTMAEQYGEMAERIRMATSSTEEYEHVQARLLDTANGTYRSMKEAQEMYILTADTLRSMGYSTDQAIDVVDSLSYAFVKNATSQERAQSAIQAFTNSMMKGKVEADSWSTIIAATPSVINDLAAATGKTAAEIRELGATGKLTSQQLSEGLRKSLDDNKKAAEGMATTVKDAFTQMRNNLSMYIGEANMANGATGLLSKSIMLFGENIDTVVKGLMVLGAGALTKYVAQMGLAVVASARAAIAAKAEAAAELEKARALVASTAAAAANATAMQHLSGSNATATAAVNAHTAAQARLATAQAAARAAGVGLTAMLGGPVGIVALVASAAAGMLLFGGNTEKAIPPVDQLTDSVEKLTAAQLENRRLQAQDAIASLKKSAQESGQGIRGLQKDYEDLLDAKKRGARISDEELAAVRRTMTEAQAENDQHIKDLQSAIDAEMKLAEAQEKRGKTAALSGPSAKADPEVQKNLAAMREQLELAKLEGEARAKLAAIQKLGKNATAAERAEAEKLAAQIYQLENARKGANAAAKEGNKASEEAKRGYESNEQKLRSMAEAITLAQLSGKSLAETQAVLAMNEYVTPEQLQAAKQMAGVLFELQERARQMDEIAKAGGIGAWVTGKVDPLSGGEFDNQAARYEAEKVAEEQRYAAQMERLTYALETEQYTYEEYYAKLEDMAQVHADRMRQIDQAKTKAQLDTLNSGLGTMTDGLKSALGEQNALYKAAAIAQTVIQTYQSAQAAFTSLAGIPIVGPALGTAAAAAAIAGGMARVNAIRSAGGRQYGGPVAANGMYRINENGAPEVFNAANGQQYMLPNRRGEVVSNKDATGGAGGRGVQVNVMNYSSAQVDVRQSQLGADDVIEIVLSDLQSGGEISQFGESRMGWGRQGR